MTSSSVQNPKEFHILGLFLLTGKSSQRQLSLKEVHHFGILPIRVCRKTLFSSDQFETPGELSLGMDY